ncbi:MAG: hypothetical protein AUJ98_11520 [Bacteroidetes bacterium CG2_30_33_31]|nr:MAG: hypothetical protein AUJ98_11520 [Bacteroidetes bacterium CG2_30_33_31]
MKSYYPNMFIVAGSGRNVGKTTFCSKIIQRFSMENRIIALKISNHFHELGDDVRIIFQSESYTIAEEISGISEKDSALFLKAGASSSFFIMAQNGSLTIAIEKLNMLVDLSADLIVAESASLLEDFKPGIAAYITDIQDISSVNGFDMVCHFNNEDIQGNIDKISLSGNNWRFY